MAESTPHPCLSCGACYANRPSPCREFAAGDARSQQARARHGLPPLVESLAA